MNEALPIALSTIVPFYIAEYKRRGGPTDTDIQRTREFASAPP
jgi:hypothetical protein